jgi:hypothetical protein
MNRIAATAVLSLVGALALAAGATASHQTGAGQGSPRDFAVGTGMNEIGRVSFAAHGGPSPLEPVTGHFHAKGEFPGTGAFNIAGPVTCLTVAGNPVGPDEAGLFYPVRDPGPMEPHGVFVFLRDNGNPSGGDQPDQIGFVPTLGPITDPPACPPVPPATLFNLEHGNVTIHDAG